MLTWDRSTNKSSPEAKRARQIRHQTKEKIPRWGLYIYIYICIYIHTNIIICICVYIYIYDMYIININIITIITIGLSGVSGLRFSVSETTCIGTYTHYIYIHTYIHTSTYIHTARSSSLEPTFSSWAGRIRSECIINKSLNHSKHAESDIRRKRRELICMYIYIERERYSVYIYIYIYILSLSIYIYRERESFFTDTGVTVWQCLGVSRNGLFNSSI